MALPRIITADPPGSLFIHRRKEPVVRGSESGKADRQRTLCGKVSHPALDIEVRLHELVHAKQRDSVGKVEALQDAAIRRSDHHLGEIRRNSQEGSRHIHRPGPFPVRDRILIIRIALRILLQDNPGHGPGRIPLQESIVGEDERPVARAVIDADGERVHRLQQRPEVAVFALQDLVQVIDLRNVLLTVIQVAFMTDPAHYRTEHQLSGPAPFPRGAMDDFSGFLVPDVQELVCPHIVRVQDQVVPIRMNVAKIVIQFRPDEFEFPRNFLFKLGENILRAVALLAGDCEGAAKE